MTLMMIGLAIAQLKVPPPAIAWSLFFAVLYLAQMVRLGRLSIHAKNPFAEPLMNVWCIIAYVPLVVALNPEEVEPLAVIIVWFREYVLYVLTGVAVLGQWMIVKSRNAHIAVLLIALKRTDEPKRRFEMAQRLQWYDWHGCLDAAAAAHQQTIDTAAGDEASQGYVAQSCVNLASIVGSRGDFARAESLCRRAISIDSSYATAYFYLAMALFEQGNRTEARDVALKSLELDLPGRYRLSVARLLAICKRE